MFNKLNKKKVAKIIGITWGFCFLFVFLINLIPDSNTEIFEKQIQKQFNPLNGSHYELLKAVKCRLSDPDSFKHINTSYAINDSCILINMKYSSKTVFNAKVVNNVVALFKIEGEVLNINY